MFPNFFLTFLLFISLFDTLRNHKIKVQKETDIHFILNLLNIELIPIIHINSFGTKFENLIRTS